MDTLILSLQRLSILCPTSFFRFVSNVRFLLFLYIVTHVFILQITCQRPLDIPSPVIMFCSKIKFSIASIIRSTFLVYQNQNQVPFASLFKIATASLRDISSLAWRFKLGNFLRIEIYKFFVNSFGIKSLSFSFNCRAHILRAHMIFEEIFFPTKNVPPLHENLFSKEMYQRH